MTEKYTHRDAEDGLKTEEDVATYFDICVKEDPADGSDVLTPGDLPIKFQAQVLAEARSV